ncbi:MAG TPA: DedA family protein [Acidimicrobiales bacterium]|nr:DedA family protein [Acidimicrobiales bacterium]
MSSTISHYGYWGLLLASILSSMCIPIPSEIAFGFAGALCTSALTGHARFTILGVIVVGTIGSVVGSQIAYEVGRSAGRAIVDRWGKWLLLTHKDLDASERWFGRYGSWSVLVGRVIPVVRAFISLPAGIAEMRRAPFAILTAVGSAVWVALLAGLGYAAGANWKHVSHDFHLATWPVVAVIVVALAYGLWHRVRAVREQAGGAQGS